jgi:hypothetical protein
MRKEKGEPWRDNPEFRRKVGAWRRRKRNEGYGLWDKGDSLTEFAPQ